MVTYAGRESFSKTNYTRLHASGRKRPGAFRGVLLQAGAIGVLTAITAVCLPLVWVRMAVSEEQPVKAAEGTELLD